MNSVSYALKFIPPYSQARWYEQSEARVLRQLRDLAEHPNILKYFGAFEIEIAGSNWQVICMERCTGTLLDFVNSVYWRNLDGAERVAGCWEIIRQILTGLKACHSWNPALWHRDVKITNSKFLLLHSLNAAVLYDSFFLSNGTTRSYCFKLGDFGLARTVLPGQALTPFNSDPEAGHQAPAISYPSYTSCVDLYGVAFLVSVLTFHLDASIDPDFPELSTELRHSRYNIDVALAIAQRKAKFMTELAEDIGGWE